MKDKILIKKNNIFSQQSNIIMFYKDIRYVNIGRGLIGRLLGLSSLFIYGKRESSIKEPEDIIKHVPPSKIVDIINIVLGLPKIDSIVSLSDVNKYTYGKKSAVIHGLPQSEAETLREGIIKRIDITD